MLSGGVFQNRRLLERRAGALTRAGLRVLVPERLPGQRRRDLLRPGRGGGARELMTERRPQPELRRILDQEVFIRGANRPFGELTLDDVRSRADELRAAIGWGPTARVAPVAQAWRELVDRDGRRRRGHRRRARRGGAGRARAAAVGDAARLRASGPRTIAAPAMQPVGAAMSAFVCSSMSGLAITSDREQPAQAQDAGRLAGRGFRLVAGEVDAAQGSMTGQVRRSRPAGACPRGSP